MRGMSLTRMVLCRLELTLLNMSLPTMVAMVGKTRAPHRILVADTWSARGVASAGIRGTGQPIPAEMAEGEGGGGVKSGNPTDLWLFFLPVNAKQMSLCGRKCGVPDLERCC